MKTLLGLILLLKIINNLNYFKENTTNLHMNAETLQFIAKRMNCWHIAQYFLDVYNYFLYSNYNSIKKKESFINPDKNFITGDVFSSLHEILNRLSDTENLFGLKKLMGNILENQDLNCLISYNQKREWTKSLELLDEIVQDSENCLTDESKLLIKIHFFTILF